jgi:hypothetical protein
MPPAGGVVSRGNPLLVDIWPIGKVPYPIRADRRPHSGEKGYILLISFPPAVKGQLVERTFLHPYLIVLPMLFPGQDIIAGTFNNNQQILESIVVAQANFQNRAGCHLGQGGFA